MMTSNMQSISATVIDPTKYQNLKYHVFRALIVLMFLGAWELFARFGLIDPFYVSSPCRVINDFQEFYLSGALVKHTGVTLLEAFSGLVIGVIVGILGGFLLGRVHTLGAVFEPIITALYGIPKLALAPVFVLWFGLGLESKVFLSGLMVFYLVFFSTYGGIKSVDRNLIASVRLMGATDLQVLSKVVLPSTVPWILSGVRGGVGASLIGAIVGEYMGASSGLGWMLAYASSFFEISRVMSCILLLLLIGIFFNYFLKYTEKQLLKWRPAVDYGSGNEGL